MIHFFPTAALIVLTMACGILRAGATPPRDARPTLFLVGDSTVRNGGGRGDRGQWGWGDRIARYFDSSRIRIVNRARGGRSCRTFITEGLWAEVLADARPGDFVIIQLGHNDGGPLAGDNRERGSLRGIGEETRQVTLTLTPRAGQKEIVHTYGWYLRKYIADARAKGLTPITCSPIPRRPRVPLAPGDSQPTSYVLWSAQVAAEQNAPFVDLNRLILAHYAGRDPRAIKETYFTPLDDTHTSAAGADLNARCVVEGIRALKDCPLKSCLLEKPRS